MWTTDWTTRAACRNTDPDVLFVQGPVQNRVKLICRGCSVRTECLADALDNRIEFGVWGGMTERERTALLRRRPDIKSWRELLETAKEEYERSLDQELEKSAHEAAVLWQFEEFYRAEFNRLVGFVMKLGARHADAVDVAQTTFLELFRSWEKVRQPRAWVRKVAARTLARQPDHRTNYSLEDVPEIPDPYPPLEIRAVEDALRIATLLKALPPLQRIVMAWVIDQFSCEEIARELEMTPEAVRKNKQRARAELKRILECERGVE